MECLGHKNLGIIKRQLTNGS